jgi:hypothetical protein
MVEVVVGALVSRGVARIRYGWVGRGRYNKVLRGHARSKMTVVYFS